MRIQGPRHPPIGPITPPIPRAMPPSMHAREDEADAGNEHPPRTSRGHTHTKALASSHFHGRGRRWQRGRHALAAHTRTKWPRPRHSFAGEADAGNGADNGTTPGDLAALTPRCAAGPDRWSMGNPAHTATQGVNMRIQGPRHPPIGPITPPIPRAMPPSMHAREDEADAGNEHPPRTSRGHTHTKALASSHFHGRGRRWQRGRHALAAHTRTKWPRPRHSFAGEADAGNGADNGTTPGDLAALTP